ncbi:MAG: serine/threonine protein kinase [Anaerolineaceae bacterium]|nr:serine/threonine protein kinase [Anaerolineaceae bacterium]
MVEKIETNQSASIIADRYRVDKLIGTGGMAVIYRAWDLKLERVIALKLLRQKYSNNPSLRDAFNQEARAAASLTHPNIVSVYDTGVSKNRIFLTLEYVAGINAKHYLISREMINIKESLDFIMQSCLAIQFAHNHNIIHCDIKPSNLLITETNQIKITDFGLAHILNKINPQEISSNIVWGSPLYISPEQILGKTPTVESDIYSLGIVLYELATGKLPFLSNDITELLNMHRGKRPEPAKNINPEISNELNLVIMTAIQKRPDRRYRSMSEFRNALVSIRQSITMRNIAPYNNSLSKNEIFSMTEPQNDKKVHSRPRPIKSETAITSKSAKRFDIITILFAFLATIAVAGLIPFWIYIYFNIPGR